MENNRHARWQVGFGPQHHILELVDFFNTEKRYKDVRLERGLHGIYTHFTTLSAGENACVDVTST
jgi:hypothetical protein